MVDKIRSQDLTDVQINLLVAKITKENFDIVKDKNKTEVYYYKNGHFVKFSPTVDWGIAGPIMAKERIFVACDGAKTNEIYTAERMKPYAKYADSQHTTYLGAAMRCLVEAEYGLEINVKKLKELEL